MTGLSVPYTVEMAIARLFFGVSLTTVFVVVANTARPVWIAAASTGAAIHSNSWGYQGCFVNEAGYYGDKFLFDVRDGTTSRD